MTSKQKAKGGALERDVAKDLSSRYNCSFVRTPHSGAYIGGSNNHRTSTLSSVQSQFYKGDVCSDEFPKLNIECKSYKEFPFHQLFNQECKILDKWIDQTLEVAEEEDINIVVFKIDHKGKYLCIESNQALNTTYGYNYKGFVIYEYEKFFINNTDILSFYGRVS